MHDFFENFGLKKGMKLMKFKWFFLQTVVLKHMKLMKIKWIFMQALVSPADAWVSGLDLTPQKMILSQKFRHLMRCKKYLNKIFFTMLSFWDTAVCLHFWAKFKMAARCPKRVPSQVFWSFLLPKKISALYSS